MSADGLAATLDLLRRVLELEGRKGYRNTAATGGVFRYFMNQFEKHEYDAATWPAVDGLLRGLKRYEAMATVDERHVQTQILLRRAAELAKELPLTPNPVEPLTPNPSPSGGEGGKASTAAPPIGAVSPAHRGDSDAMRRVRAIPYSGPREAHTPSSGGERDGQNPSPPAPLPQGARGDGGQGNDAMVPAAASGATGDRLEASAPRVTTNGGRLEAGAPTGATDGGRLEAGAPSEPLPRQTPDSMPRNGSLPSPLEGEDTHPAGAGVRGAVLPSPLEGGGTQPTVAGGRGIDAVVRGSASGAKDSPAMSLAQPLREVVKMRTQEAEKLERLGVRTVEQALYYLPRDHYDCRNPLPINKLKPGLTTTLIGTLKAVEQRRTARKLTIVEARIADETAMIRVTWFSQYMAALLRPRIGQRIAISGHAEIVGGRLQFEPRDYEFPDEDELTHTNALVPIYPLTEGLTQRWLRNAIKRALNAALHLVEDPLDAALTHAEHPLHELARAYGLPALRDALAAYHFPADEDAKARAVHRLAFDELLCVGIGMEQRRRAWQSGPPAHAIPRDEAALDLFMRSLPFALTGAQRRALDAILADMARPIPMSRLLQGDVGSGKTVVAAAALLLAARSGAQGAIMAPTEILAEQHARSIGALLGACGVEVALLTGSVKGAERKRVYAGAADGTLPVVVGTHALIQEGVAFAKLGLVVVDEQHRFGVEQRGLLRQKGFNPHMLAMTATPIPRTLTHTIYGDLDVAVIDERPPGRQPVETRWEAAEASAFRLVRAEVEAGRQAYVICPLVEESDKLEARAAVAEHKRLDTQVFPDLSVGLLHGKMKPAEKEATLRRFRDGEIQVLVATSVVEVGIDVPNATVMVVEQANRFGLSQLHQFRGRVGRGADRSYCILLAADASAAGQQRLGVLVATDDGFKLAEEDLRLRGPGDFLGTRQSGLPELQVAGLGDMRSIEQAREAARRLIAADPELARPEHCLLAQRVARFWRRSGELS